MSEIDEIGILGIPENSKLLVLGDWYRKPGQAWKVVCYFRSADGANFRSALPVDFLPALYAGTVFPRSHIANSRSRYTATVKLPSQLEWMKVKFVDLPESLRQAKKLMKQFEHCVVYRIPINGKFYWLPASELARVFFFHSAELVRAAVYQGNTWQLGKARAEGKTGFVDLSLNVPVSYIGNSTYRKFYAWLFFSSGIERSFGSIFESINRNSRVVNGAQKWTFDFDLPDMSQYEITIAGFNGRALEDKHVLVQEVSALSGLRPPDLDVIYFSHPNDRIWLESEGQASALVKSLSRRKASSSLKDLDPSNQPKPTNRRNLLRLGPASFNFDLNVETRRTLGDVKSMPANSGPGSDEPQSRDLEELASLLQGSDRGKLVGADIDNIEEPKLLDAPEKFEFFQALLRSFEEYGWGVKSRIGDVPRMQCRRLHLISGRPRRYCYAQVVRADLSIVHVLEIELCTKRKKDGTEEMESLSTLFFRTKDKETIYLRFLDELMTANKEKGLNTMSWKREPIAERTLAREYLGHPDSKIASEQDALVSWVARAVEKIEGM